MDKKKHSAPIQAPKPIPEPIKIPEPEKKHVFCECGKIANPDSHQCWGCSHRS